jgi:NAD(P)-dependent dehydrogenase (short-subunit alcohol dehydrogenase family)
VKTQKSENIFLMNYFLDKMKKLLNKSVFITGGLSGIGKECALAAKREGAKVAIAYRKSERSEKRLAEMKVLIPEVVFIECDVSLFEEAEKGIAKAVLIFGRIDIALNAAGIGGNPNKLGEMSKKDWHQVIDTNLNGVFNCMRHELTQMSKQKKGIIVNIASVLGKIGFASSSHYVAAKHGVIGLTQTAAIEYATEGIRVNAICPGFIETPMIARSSINDNAQVKQHIIDLHPMKRMSKAEEIANGFIFLASDDSSFITGTALEIDGGLLAT